MLTRRGWGLTIGGIVLAVAGRLLGLLELYVLAAGCWALMAAALAYLALRPADVEARRTLTPARVQAGDESRVELAVRNLGARSTPVLELRDPVGGGPRRARLLLAPVPPGVIELAHYRIPTEGRAVLSVGPLEARRSDPLSLATSTRTVAPQSELVVFPPVEELLPLPHAPGDDRRGGVRRATAVGATGQDFYALRPWAVGDDLRRVHWPSTARRDELMVRQHDIPWQGRATVVLDVRARFHDENSLEQAVSAAAGIVVSCGRGGSLVRLITTDGGDSGFGSGTAHVEALLERLARVKAGHGELPDLPHTTGSMALVVTADVPAADLSHLARLGGQPGSLALVVVARAGRHAPPAFPGIAVLVGPGDPLAPRWNRSMAAAGVVRGAVG
ncbi:MAG TPA: DUF58 domain-containing protein [Acidimicrobiales bacterium]|nr:DUF58 domain-containing protein [Acidimicrobiales bacterium]